MDIKVDPAHAGMILDFIVRETPPDGGPRACGDDPLPSDNTAALMTWTPRMRG